ncbi:MAG: hypothetical protein AMXMBFR64_47690 [Myxococcales bacterium]
MNKGPLTQLGKYHILEKIASGGMATVHRARLDLPEGASRVVALKVLHPHLAEDPDYVAMFQDEGRLMRRLDHPNLLSAFDHGTVEGWHFIAMELLPCVSLAALCDHLDQRKRAMELPDALFVISEVLAGLAWAHALTDERGTPLGVIHRDVSPQNVLLTTGGQVKLIDFGIARGRNRSVYSAVGVVKGKAGYMSPEQAAGYPDVDARTDIYAAGVLAYELVTGRLLFGDGDTDRIRRRIVNAPDPALPADADLPVPLQDALTTALRRNPADRFMDAVAFRTTLEAILAELRYAPDRKRLGELARDVLEAKEGAKRKERKSKEKERKAAARLKVVAPVPSGDARPGRTAVPGQTAVVELDGDQAAVRWMARAALGLMAASLLMELFGLRLPP